MICDRGRKYTGMTPTNLLSQEQKSAFSLVQKNQEKRHYVMELIENWNRFDGTMLQL